MKNTLSIYGSHDSAAVFIDKKNQLRILEYERFVKKRYAMYSEKFDYRSNDLGTDQESRISFIKYIKTQLSSNIELILYNGLTDTDIIFLRTEFPDAKFQLQGHHLSHAASGYFTSDFDRSLILSVDGGGVDDGMIAYTKIFHGESNEITLLDTPDINLGVAYGRIGTAISEINPGPDSNTDSLVYAGKVMGICAYGNIRTEWVDAIRKYYKTHSLNQLGKSIGLSLHFNSLKGQDSFDLAATSQFVFEEYMMNLIDKYIDEYDNFVLVGGCALNVLFNQSLKKRLDSLKKNLYVPSNPNDCGLALGQFLLEHRCQCNVYNGFELLDKERLEYFIEARNAVQVSTTDIVDLIKQGKIIGLVEAGSEVGPRALGNRSIICDPSISDMKDILNAKVKFREWFRPFAPVCRLEDKDLYFDDAYESEFMSYAPMVKETYRKNLAAICHYDNTARLQTVAATQHETFYNILTEMYNRDQIAVILNTSFNIKGKPILTTIEDALYCLDNTQMDHVIVNGWLFDRR